MRFILFNTLKRRHSRSQFCCDNTILTLEYISAPIEHWILNVERYTQYYTVSMHEFDGVRTFNVNKLYHSVWQNLNWKPNVSQLRVQYIRIHAWNCISIDVIVYVFALPHVCILSKQKHCANKYIQMALRNQIEWKTMKRGWAAVRRRIYAQLTFSYWIKFNMATSCRSEQQQ